MRNLLKTFERFGSLTKGQQEFFAKNGYLVLEKALSNQSIDSLVERTNKMVDEADVIRDQVRKLALNKIGHAMHDIDQVYEKFSYQPVFRNLLKGLGYSKPILTQSMFIFKNQKFGTKVDMHTDNTYIISRPRLSCLGIWCALEDARKDNGCMFAFPGSHLHQTDYFLVLDDTRRKTDYVGPLPNYEQKYDQRNAACLEVPKGTVIALHGDLVHFSGHNHSSESRHAYTMHFVDVGNGNKWSEESWLQRTPELPFRDYYTHVDKIN